MRLTTILNRLIEPRHGIPKERQTFSNQDLKALIVPLIIEQVLAMMVGMADTVMVSHAGEAAISGVSLVDMVNGVFLYVFNALGAGGAIIVSQYIGSRDLEQGRKSAGQLMMISVLLSSLFLAAIAVGNRGLLDLLFGQVSPQVMDAALTYLIITAFTALFRAMGLSSVTMKISLGMNILNVVGNAVGVFVLRAGVVGVAVASLVSRAAAALLMFVLLLDKKRPISLRVKDIFSWNGKLLRRILGVAIPGGIESGLFQVCRVAMTSIIATFGAAQIAANGVALSIDNVNTIVNSVMGLALTTVVGQCVGAADYDQAAYYIKKMLPAGLHGRQFHRALFSPLCAQSVRLVPRGPAVCDDSGDHSHHMDHFAGNYFRPAAFGHSGRRRYSLHSDDVRLLPADWATVLLLRFRPVAGFRHRRDVAGHGNPLVAEQLSRHLALPKRQMEKPKAGVIAASVPGELFFGTTERFMKAYEKRNQRKKDHSAGAAGGRRSVFRPLVQSAPSHVSMRL